MSVGRLISRAIVREIARTERRIARTERQKYVYRRLQNEAASRPESRRVETLGGEVWMSPIEFKLYEAMRREGLNPIPQFCIEGYYADFAFPDVRVAIEADGAAYHGGDRRERDRKREWILRRAGWTVKRFYGTTIHHKAANCAYVVKQEVEARRQRVRARFMEEELERQARRDALLRPFRKVIQWLRRIGHREVARTAAANPPPAIVADTRTESRRGNH